MRRIIFVCAAVFLSGVAPASAVTITFSGFGHGQIMNTQIPGVTISAVNIGGGPHIAAIFDTTVTGSADPDLQINAGSRTGWAPGNLPSNTDLGNVLFIAENSTGSGNGILDNPDDEGSRPAGSLIFEFVNPISTFGFDLIDVESTDDAPAGEMGSVEFSNAGGVFMTVSFSSLGDLPGLPPIFGDATANRILPFALSQTATKVEIKLGGSGAVDNITFDTPEPATATLVILSAGFLGIAAFRRRRS